MNTWENWQTEIHDDEEQLKRIERAKKADQTPLGIDEEFEIGVFAGSGKQPYEVSLTSCTCSDFVRRKLPCKHIYRLAMELGYIKCDFKSNRNHVTKHNLNDYIFAFTPKAQKILFDLCHPSGEGEIIIKKGVYDNELNELIEKDFCIQGEITTQLISEYSLPYIKDIIYSLNFDNPPKKSAHTTTVLKWLDENESEFLPAVNSQYMRIDLTEGTKELKNTIYRRYFSRFEKYLNEIGYYETKEIFTQDPL